MQIEPKLKDRLAKLLALTKSTNEHESASAQSRIEKLCKLHNVDLDLLFGLDEKVTMHWFKYTDAYSERVLSNTIWKVTNITQLWTNKGRPNQTGVECTESQAQEVKLWWAIMQRAFLQEMHNNLDALAAAFIRANNLYGTSELKPQDPDAPYDWERAHRVNRLAGMIEPTTVLPALGEK